MEVLKRTKHDIYPFISAEHRLRDTMQGKVVVVTGGGKGVGKAVARQFALAGAISVVISGRHIDDLQTAKKEIEQAAPSCNVITKVADVTKADDVATIFNGVTADILVNNAGVSLSQDLITESEPETWWEDWEINVRGLYLCTRQFLLSLERAGDKPGVVLNVSSSVADLASPNMSSYGGSKLGVLRFTEAVQLEYGDRSVRCLAFHPGSIASTGMGQTAPEQFRHRLIDTVDLAGGTALYLSTSDASYLNGRFVYSNWDMEKVESLKSEILDDDLLVSRLRYGKHLSEEVEGLPPA